MPVCKLIKVYFSLIINDLYSTKYTIRGLSQITFALRVGRWSEKRVVYYIKSAN